MRTNDRFSYLEGFRCRSCGREFEPGRISYTCAACGPILGTLDAVYDVAALQARCGPEIFGRRPEGDLWRYHELLPVRRPDRSPGHTAGLPMRMTPLYKPGPRLGLSLPRLLIKDDTRHPSGSAKDRATAVALVHAREHGAPAVAAASTGNAASSLAAFAAQAGLPCHIFVPRDAPPAKLVQIQACGANLFAVDGTYDQAFDLCAALCDRLGLYNRNTATNPVLGEGKKTIALEIWEQLGLRAPDAVVVPVGDGCILGGVHKGFRDLLDLGWIERMPRMIGVQAEGSAALAEAWAAGRDLCQPVEARTVADSLSVSMPRDQVKALRAVRESKGCFVKVADEAILEALAVLASRAGLFVEPAAAAGLAGIHRAAGEGKVLEEDEVVLVLTGHGLKDIDAARRAASWNSPIAVAPDAGVVERVLAARMGRS